MLWAQRSFQNHYQTFPDRFPEKNRTSPENIGPLVDSDMSGKYGTGPDLHICSDQLGAENASYIDLSSWYDIWFAIICIDMNVILDLSIAIQQF